MVNQKVNSYQLCQLIRTATGFPNQSKPNQDPMEFLMDIADEGWIKLPCDGHDVFWIPERVPIFADIRRPVKSSILLRQLFDRNADTVLVVDALISGKDTLHLLRLTEDMEEVLRWVRGLSPNGVALTLKSIDETKLIVTTLRSYVFGIGN